MVIFIFFMILCDSLQLIWPNLFLTIFFVFFSLQIRRKRNRDETGVLKTT